MCQTLAAASLFILRLFATPLVGPTGLDSVAPASPGAGIAPRLC